MSSEPQTMEKSQVVRSKDKRNFRTELKFKHEPIDSKHVKANLLTGEPIDFRLISKEFSLKIQGLEYKEPTFFDISANTMLLHQALFEMKKFETLMSYIVSLPYFRFWSTIAYSKEIQRSLESFLIFASRPYRAHPECREGDYKAHMANIHRVVFKIFVRILLPNESQRNFMTEAYHRKLLMSTGDLLSAPNIISLLQIYGYSQGSESICRLLRPFVMSNRDSFILMIDEMAKVLESFNPKIFAGDATIVLPNVMYLVSNITDIVFTLNKLPLIEPQIYAVYNECNLTAKLIPFYGHYFQAVELGLTKIPKWSYSRDTVNLCLGCIKSQLKLAQSCSLLLVHNWIAKGLIKSIYEPAARVSFGDSHPFELIIQTLIQITESSIYCYDFFKIFQFQAIFAQLMRDNELNDGYGAGEVLSHYKYAVDKNASEVNKQRKLKNEANKSVAPTIDFSLPRDILYGVGPAETTLTLYSEENQSNERKFHLAKLKARDDAFEEDVAKKEKQIADLFPDLGDGYIYKCLEHFNFNVEFTVDAILCKKLPPQLDSISVDIQKSDLVNGMQDASTSNPNTSPSDWPTIDRFDPAEITANPPIEAYIGKKDKIGELLSFNNQVVPKSDEKVKQWMKSKTLRLADNINEQEEEEYEAAKLLMERGKLTAEDMRKDINYIGITGLYEDEFDDTYGEVANVDATLPDKEDDPSKDSDESNGAGNNNNNQEQQQQQHNRWSAQSNHEKRDNANQYYKNKQHNKREYNNKRKAQQKQAVVVPPPPPQPTVATASSGQQQQQSTSAPRQGRQGGGGGQQNRNNNNNRSSQGRPSNSKQSNLR